MLQKQEIQIRKQKHEEEYKKYSKKYNTISLLRLIVFLIMLCAFITSFFYAYILLIFLVLLVLFVILCILHLKTEKQKIYHENSLSLLKELQDKIEGTYLDDGKNTGLRFINETKEKPFLTDLDIIGKNSLFSYLNISKTIQGKKRLFHSLSNPHFSEDELHQRQESIQEISNNHDFYLDFCAKEKSIPEDLVLSPISEIKTRFTSLFLTLGILFSIGFITSLIFYLMGESIGYSMICIVLQLLFTFIYLFINKSSLDSFHSVQIRSDAIYEMMKEYPNIEFQSVLLKNYTKSIQTGKKGIKEIHRIAGYDTLRYHNLTLILSNLLFPFSILIIKIFEKRIHLYKTEISNGLESFEKLEELVSLSTISYIHSSLCIPRRVKEISIQFHDLSHPLISNCTSNSFQMIQNLNIITGSNMSGKTTFMRTIGINLILMNAGSFVCASSFEASYFTIFTSMKIQDDLSNGISTFYQELLRIKKSLDYNKTNEPMITFIDEVFKGTNSNDRIEGAKILLKQLNSPNSVVFITTHDFELCDIKDIPLENYYFEEHYSNNTILFDYKIHSGKCKTTNAKYLMKMIGISIE